MQKFCDTHKLASIDGIAQNSMYKTLFIRNQTDLILVYVLKNQSISFLFFGFFLKVRYYYPTYGFSSKFIRKISINQILYVSKLGPLAKGNATALFKSIY